MEKSNGLQSDPIVACVNKFLTVKVSVKDARICH